LCTAYDSHILLSTKKQNNIQKLLRYVPQEYQKEYEFAVPKETTNTATELRESMLAIQTINLEDNNHTETERETPTSSIKQSIPFFTANIARNCRKIVSKPSLKLLNHLNAKVIHRREIPKKNFDDFIEDEEINSPDASSSEREIIDDDDDPL